MTQNDLIANYVLERKPEITETLDFALYRMRMMVGDIADRLLQKTYTAQKNGDYIRSMDDATLASFLWYGVHEDSEEGAKVILEENRFHDCEEILEWLGEVTHE